MLRIVMCETKMKIGSNLATCQVFNKYCPYYDETNYTTVVTIYTDWLIHVYINN